MITLKPIAVTELEFARQLRNDNKQFFFNPVGLSASAQMGWFDRLEEKRKHTPSYEFYVILVNKILAGTVSVEKKDNRLHIGNLILADCFRGKHLLPLILDKISQKYHTPKLEVVVLGTNNKAYEIYKHVGFQEVGKVMRTI